MSLARHEQRPDHGAPHPAQYDWTAHRPDRVRHVHRGDSGSVAEFPGPRCATADAILGRHDVWRATVFEPGAIVWPGTRRLPDRVRHELESAGRRFAQSTVRARIRFAVGS